MLGTYYFSNAIYQNYLFLQPLHRLLKVYNPNYVKVTAWKSTGLYLEDIIPPNLNIAPDITYFYNGDQA